MNQIHALLVTAPVAVREHYRRLTAARLVDALAGARPDPHTGTARVVLGALRTLAQRHQFLTPQAGELQEHLRELVAELNPTLLAAHGVDLAALLIAVHPRSDRPRHRRRRPGLRRYLRRRAPRVDGHRCTARRRLSSSTPSGTSEATTIRPTIGSR